MHIVIFSSEVAPFSKTGGLGDVAGALPLALSDAGQQVTVFTPLYREVRRNAEARGLHLEVKEEVLIPVPLGDAGHTARLVKGRLPDSEVCIYFLENDYYFDRAGLYVDPATGEDYQDNSERFIFFSRGSLLAAIQLGLDVDVLHAHDWQTGLIPSYHRHMYSGEFADAVSVFTVHNVAYQGLFWHRDMALTGLPWELFNWHQLEFFGNLSLLKAGVTAADGITTVSRQYAREIQTGAFGMNMEGVFQERSADLRGIVNGVDYSVWNPECDSLIPANFSPDDLSGKAVCRAELLKEFGLPADERAAVIGMIGRLVRQKGFDLVAEEIDRVMENNLQIVLLGEGGHDYSEILLEAAAAYPDRFGIKLEFDERLAHLVEAGADMLLMPSRFEPCGLNQLYSMKYGTVPLVARTGGLADTVADYDEDNERGTGFVFAADSPADMTGALDKALALYENDPGRWRKLMLNGMTEDRSWGRSAREYLDFFKEKLESQRT